MHCEQMLPLIEKLADGEAAASEKAQAEAHMEACESCRAHFRFLEALPEAARKAPLPEPPGMYWEVLPRKVMARIEQERSPKSSPGRLAGWAGLRWLGAVAAAVIAIVVGMEVSTLRQTEAPAALDSAGLEGKAKTPEPVPLSEVVEPERQPLGASVPADPGVENEIRRLADAVPEPAFEEEPVAGKEDRPAVLARSRGQPSASVASVAGEADEAVEATLASQRVEVVRPTDRLEQVESPSDLRDDEDIAAGILPAAPAPAEVPATQEEVSADPPARERRADVVEKRAKDNYLAVAEPSGARRSTALKTLSVQQKSETELQAECQSFRKMLAENPESEQAVDTRYQLARCSVRLFERRPTDENRRQAVQDMRAFLGASSEGERADEILRKLQSIQQ
jgi:hypothetical protein